MQNSQLGRSDNSEQNSLPVVDTQSELTVAWMPWCDLFEDFFDTIGVSFEAFCEELTGGWLFNNIEALQLAGVRSVIFFVSARVSTTLRLTHAPTGAKVCILPASTFHRVVRSIRRHILNSKLETISSYLSTPLGLLARELQREGCTAIVCQEYESTRFDACVLLGQLMRLPVFATFQGGGTGIKRSRLTGILRPLTIRACDGLIIATRTELERVAVSDKVSPAKLARIFNPMDVTNWGAIDRNEARATLGIPLHAQVVVYHGRIEIHIKGLDILLHAWEQLCRDRLDRDLRLLLVGTGSDANELRQRIEKMQLRGVIWIDEFVRDRVAIQRYLSAADVYTLPSRYEGFPVAPIEAMACGLPVVAAEADGMRDILEEGEASGGLLVPCGDADALATALGRILDNEAWRCELGKQARRRTEEYFSLEIIGKQLRDFIFSRQVSSNQS